MLYICSSDLSKTVLSMYFNQPNLLWDTEQMFWNLEFISLGEYSHNPEIIISWA